jgi:hypothetical protein
VDAGILSRLGGSAVNLAWGGSTLVLTLLFLTMLPLKEFGLNGLRRDMNASYSYRLLERAVFGIKKPPSKPQQEEISCPACAVSKAEQDALVADDDVQALLNDERVQKMIADPAIKAAADKKDFAKLLTNPAIMELAKDPAFLAKFLKAYPKIRARMNQ